MYVHRSTLSGNFIHNRVQSHRADANMGGRPNSFYMGPLNTGQWRFSDVFSQKHSFSSFNKNSSDGFFANFNATGV